MKKAIKNSKIETRTKRVEKITFDTENRREFIMGFSKRKSARKLKGQKRAELESREKRLAARNSVRKHMSAELRRSEEAEPVIVKDTPSISKSESKNYKEVNGHSDSFGNVTVVTTTW